MIGDYFFLSIIHDISSLYLWFFINILVHLSTNLSCFPRDFKFIHYTFLLSKTLYCYHNYLRLSMTFSFYPQLSPHIHDFPRSTPLIPGSLSYSHFFSPRSFSINHTRSFYCRKKPVFIHNSYLIAITLFHIENNIKHIRS